MAGALALIAALSAGAWWFLSTRPSHSASGVNLGTLGGGGSLDDLNLLVVTLDTTRADRIGAYGYQSIETPTIDRLAREGVLFEETMCTAPLTLPAHSSIFTGKFPPEHGVRDNGGYFLSPQQLTLATVLERKGLRTGAVVGAYVLDGKWGLNQGFDTYVDDFDLSKLSGFAIGDVQRPGNEVVDRALPWLEKVKGKRFFAWLHFYDPHTPYEAPEPFNSRYEHHPYNAEIAFVDSQLARVIAFLEQNRLLDRTIVAVMGDHGEGLDQHDEGTHGFFVYQSTMRVPFVIRTPFARMQGRRVADPVRSVDLMPTVLDLMGIPPPRNIAGVSLTPLMTGDRKALDLDSYGEAVYPLHHFGWSELRAWRAGRYKVIDAPRPELYDLEKDPHETTNLYAQRQPLADGMLAKLREQERESPAGAQSAAPPEVDSEARARLAALGYVGSFVASVSGPHSERADPKDKIELFNLMTEAREIAKDEKSADKTFDKLVAMYRQVVTDDPNVIDAWFNLGNVYSRARRFPEAIGYFRKALELKPDYDLAVINMANAYRQLGQEDAALAGFEHYLTIDPKNSHVRYQVGEIYLDRGDTARAERNFREALDINPREAPARNALGVIAFQHGDLSAAEREVRAALDIRTDVRLAHYNLALIAEERNDLVTAEREYRKELELHPNAYRAAFNLARLYERQGNAPAQIASLQQAVDQNPGFPEGQLFLAKAYLDTGARFPDGIRLAQRALELGLRPELTPLAHFVLADLYNRVGRSQEAAREVQRGRAAEAAARRGH